MKVSAAALRSVLPDYQDSNGEAEASGSESETEPASEPDAVLPAPSKDPGGMGSSSRGSLEEQKVVVSETRRVLAAAMKQQQRRRAAAAVAAAAAARLTAVTTARLEACANSSELLTWRALESTSSTASSSGAQDEGWSNAGVFLIFSGTSTLRNAVWCTPLETLLEARRRRRSSVTPIAPVAARPLASLFRVLQQFSPRESEYGSAELMGPHLTQIVVLSKEGLLIAGTSDGRVLLLPADTPTACACVSKQCCR